MEQLKIDIHKNSEVGHVPMEGYPITLDGPLSMIHHDGDALAKIVKDVTGISTGEVPLIITDSIGSQTAVEITINEGKWKGTSFAGFFNKNDGWRSWESLTEPKNQ